jgi:O-antigen ligase
MQLTLMPRADAIASDSPQRAGGLGARPQQAHHDPWPTSLSFWMVAFYMALFLIRPWEILFPWMAVFPIERTVAIFTIATVILGGQFWFRLTGQTVTILAFLGAVTLSAMLGLDPSTTADELYRYITVLAWYFLLNSVMRTPRALLAMGTWWLFVMGLYMFKSLWDYFVHSRHDWAQGVPRLMGLDLTYGNVNEFAGCVTFTLPALYFVFKGRGEFGPRWRKWLNLGMAAYLVMALACIVLSNSRSGMIKAMAFFLLVSLRGQTPIKKLGYLVGAAVLMLAVWMVMPDASRNRFRTLWDESAGSGTAMESLRSRLEGDGLRVGLHVLERFPLTGVGTGNFGTYRARYYDGAYAQAHNLAGQALGETGLLGTITFVLMVAVTLANCRRVRSAARVDADPRLRLMSECAASCRDTLVLLLVSGIAGHNMFFYHWVWLAAFSQCAVQCVESARREGSGWPIPYGVAPS